MQTHPTSFGVFKPVGHVLMAFASTSDADQASAALLEAGFSAADIRRYSAEEMLLQANEDIRNAEPLASLGQELNLVKAQREQALAGQCFVLVHAPQDEQVARVTALAQQHHASGAQLYGRLVIEELLPVGTDSQQVAESPDRGLDLQRPVNGDGRRG